MQIDKCTIKPDVLLLNMESCGEEGYKVCKEREFCGTLGSETYIEHVWNVIHRMLVIEVFLFRFW